MPAAKLRLTADQNCRNVLCTRKTTGMRHITTFWSTTDRLYDGGPIRL